MPDAGTASKSMLDECTRFNRRGLQEWSDDGLTWRPLMDVTLWKVV
jgi:hypothetical protein